MQVCPLRIAHSLLCPCLVQRDVTTAWRLHWESIAHFFLYTIIQFFYLCGSSSISTSRVCFYCTLVWFERASRQLGDFTGDQLHIFFIYNNLIFYLRGSSPISTSHVRFYCALVWFEGTSQQISNLSFKEDFKENTKSCGTHITHLP